MRKLKLFTYSHITNIYWKRPLVAIIYGANLNLWPLLLSDCAIIVRLCWVTEIIHEMEFILNEDHFRQQLWQQLYFLWHGNFMVGKSGKIRKKTNTMLLSRFCWNKICALPSHTIDIRLSFLQVYSLDKSKYYLILRTT